VAQALFDLEATNNELKADLRDLFINSAKEVDISSGRKAIVIHVPFRLLKSFHKVQQRLVRELEKKFSGKDVVIVANRRIMPKPTTGAAIARPRSRTLTAGAPPSARVHGARGRVAAQVVLLGGLAACCAARGCVAPD
jgi:small subunit ribosomal protein S7e